MATPDQYDFVNHPPEELFCPVTKELLLEPHQTLCCGHYLSQDTVNRIQCDEKPCPMCRKQPLKTVTDKAFRRKIHSLNVYCPNKCEGCEWMGELGNLDDHLSANCEYMVDCEFRYAGCGAKLHRKQVRAHMKRNVHKHLLLVASDLRHEKQLRTDLQEQVRAQQKQIDIIFGALSHSQPLPPVFIPPQVITMTDFERCKRDGYGWFSPPFYSHVGGYKMCICVVANGWEGGKGTHVTVYVHMMRGEYDDHLRWPFRGDITVQLLNQRRDKEHVEMTIVFDDRVSDEVAGRVVGQERAYRGWGFAEFIAHIALGYNAEKNTEYLKKDCLKFQVTNVIVKSII